MEHVGPDPVPEQLHAALVAIGLQNTGTAELEEVQTRMRPDQGGDIVLARRIETRVPVRHPLPQEPIGAHDLGPCGPEAALLRAMVEDEKVIAEDIIGIDVAPGEPAGWRRFGRHLAVEHLEAKPLGLPDLGRGRGEADLEGSDPAENGIEAPVIANHFEKPGQKGRAGGRNPP